MPALTLQPGGRCHRVPCARRRRTSGAHVCANDRGQWSCRSMIPRTNHGRLLRTPPDSMHLERRKRSATTREHDGPKFPFPRIEVKLSEKAFAHIVLTRIPETRPCFQSDRAILTPACGSLSIASQEVIGAWAEGIDRLLKAGVTGRILLANVGSPKGLPVSTLGLAESVVSCRTPFVQQVYLLIEQQKRERTWSICIIFRSFLLQSLAAETSLGSSDCIVWLSLESCGSNCLADFSHRASSVLRTRSF